MSGSVDIIGVVNVIFGEIDLTWGVFFRLVMGAGVNICPEMNELASKLFKTFFRSKIFSELRVRVR